MPVSLSCVSLGPWSVPIPGTSNATSDPPGQRSISGLPESSRVCGNRRNLRSEPDGGAFDLGAVGPGTA
jgi:hypothetical protein